MPCCSGFAVRAARRRARCWILVAALAPTCPAALGEPAARAPVTQPQGGTSSVAAMRSARRSIPWAKLSPHDQGVARRLTSEHSVFRRMPARTVLCDPAVFTFLLERPEVVAGIWNHMGVSALRVQRTSATTFRATDHAGTEGVLRVLHAECCAEADNELVLLGEGVYEANPLPRPVRASSLLVLRSRPAADADGEPMVSARLDAFIRFDRAAADLVAKTLRPLIGRTADHNFTETMRFVSSFSQAARRNPGGLARLATQLDGLDAPTRQGLIDVCRAASPPRRAAAVRVGARR